MSSEVLRQERFGGTLLLTIDRPDAGNAINSEVSAALEDALGGERSGYSLVLDQRPLKTGLRLPRNASTPFR